MGLILLENGRNHWKHPTRSKGLASSAPLPIRSSAITVVLRYATEDYSTLPLELRSATHCFNALSRVVFSSGNQGGRGFIYH